ncbi:MAG: acetyl-CoA synthetase [Thermoplasmata archaeon]|nr:MAG: acetyl-CoA synthetase [Thermoplasmata archaeon]
MFWTLLETSTVFFRSINHWRSQKRWGLKHRGMFSVRGKKVCKILRKKIGYPLVIKAVVEGKTHKTEFGGVAIDIGNEEELIDKANKIVGRLKDMGIYDKFAGFVLQEMVSGIEVIIGGLRDEKFGPLVMLGVGGIFVEIMRDISFRIAPIARTDALEMMAELKAGRIFEGFRGRGVNKDEIIDAIVRASRVIASMERIKEMEFNPVIVNEEGAFVVDARFVLK